MHSQTERFVASQLAVNRLHAAKWFSPSAFALGGAMGNVLSSLRSRPPVWWAFGVGSLSGTNLLAQAWWPCWDFLVFWAGNRSGGLVFRIFLPTATTQGGHPARCERRLAKKKALHCSSPLEHVVGFSWNFALATLAFSPFGLTAKAWNAERVPPSYYSSELFPHAAVGDRPILPQDMPPDIRRTRYRATSKPLGQVALCNTTPSSAKASL